jgi:hypothetical protein
MVAEVEREDLVRGFACPSCGAEPGVKCGEDWQRMPFSHTARYNLAAAAGLVPALPKGPTKGSRP